MKKEMDSFIQFLRDKKNAPHNTIMSYERDLRHFREFLEGCGHAELFMIEAADIKAYLEHQHLYHVETL